MLTNKLPKQLKRKAQKLALTMLVFTTLFSHPYSVVLADEVASEAASAMNSSENAAEKNLSELLELSTKSAVLSEDEKSQKISELSKTDNSGRSAEFKSKAFVKKLYKKVFQAKEEIQVLVKNTYDENFSVRIKDFSGNEREVEVKKERLSNQMIMTLKTDHKMKPGKYTLEVLNEDGDVVSQQDFSWGVLAINTTKATYQPNETADIHMAVLDERGNMVCDAKLELDITAPNGNTKTLSTEDSSIIVNDACKVKGITDNPDYETTYQVGAEGYYMTELTATTDNGKYSIDDSFTVSSDVAFDVERDTATRIYPPADYNVNVNIEAQKDFKGEIIETVPESFAIKGDSEEQEFEIIEGEYPKEEEDKEGEVLGASTAMDLISPVKGDPELTGLFGDQLHDPLLKEKYKKYGLEGHDGVDFAVGEGTEVLAVDSGEVVLAQENFDYGTTLVIQHDWGKSYYGHLSGFNINTGDEVRKGEVVAYSGSTGLSTAPHLHLGIKLNKYDSNNGYYGKIDPSKYIGIKEEVKEDEEDVLGVSESKDNKENVSNSDNKSDVKTLIWDVNVEKGDEINLSYTYNAPDESPQFYTLGPLAFYDENGEEIFSENREWQIAVDASFVARPEGPDVTSNWSVAGSSCSGSHWCTIDDNVEDPTAGDFTDRIETSGNGTTDRFDVTDPSNVDTATDLVAKVHTDATGGNNNMQVQIALYINGTQVGSTHSCANSTGTAAWCTASTISGSWSQADINSLELELTSNKNGGGPADTVRVSAAYVDITYTSSAATNQDHFRWRNDDGSESTATWKASEDSNSIGNISKNTGVRLRFEVGRIGTTESASRQYQLEWASQTGGACGGGDESWANADTTSDAVEILATDNLTDGNSTTNQLNTGSGTHVNGEVKDTSDITGAIGPLAADENTEIEYSFQMTANAGNDTTYCFRVTDNGTALTGYNVYPELTTSPPSPMELVQEGYIFESDDGSSVDGNTQQAAADTAITGVKKGERVTARFHIKNTSGAPGESSDVGLFYDKGDGIWSKVTRDGTPVTSGGSSGWDTEIVHNTGSVDSVFSSLAFSPSTGNPWISYEDEGSHALTVANYVESGGDCDTFDSDGGSDAWECTVVHDTGSSGSWYSSLAFSPSGDPWIAYGDRDNGALTVAEYVGSGGDCDTISGNGGSDAWECTVVHDTNGTNGAITISLAFSPSTGNPWISYEDDDKNALTVAEYVGSGGDCDTFDSGTGSDAWECTVVHDTGATGSGFSSLAFSPEGNAWIAYEDGDNDALTVANYVESGGDCDTISGNGGSDAWECTVVHDSGTSGSWYSSLAFSPEGNAWIAYEDGDNGALTVANYVESGGDCDTISGNGGSDAWECTVVHDTGTNGSLNVSLAFSPSGDPWISYEDDDNDALTVANYVESGGDCDTISGNGGSDAWECTVVHDTGTNGSAYSSLAFSPSGSAWIAYNDQDEHALTVANTFRQGEIIVTPGLAGDNGDAISESHADMTGVGDTSNRDDADCLSASTWSNGKWFESEQGNSIGIDDDVCTEVAFTIDTSQAVKGETYRLALATKDGWREDKGLWRGPVNISEYPSITIESNTIKRYAKDNMAQMADCTDTSWGCAVVDSSSSSLGIRWISNTRDVNGDIWLAYRDETNGALKVANYVGGGNGNCSNTDWDCTTVDTTNDSGTSTSIAADHEGNIWVSYQDYDGGGSQTLRLATNHDHPDMSSCTDSSWDCTEINGTASSGWETSLAISPKGEPWIMHGAESGEIPQVVRYVGSGNGNCTNNAFECMTLETGDTGWYGSIAFSPEGIPWVSYQADTAGELRVAKWVGTGGDCASDDRWECMIVDGGTDDDGLNTSLAFDHQGRASISYYDASNFDTKFATYVGGSGSGCDGTDASLWNCEVVDGANNVQSDTTLAFDAEGTAWIAVYDQQSVNDQALRVIKHVGGSSGSCSNTSWDCTYVDDSSASTGEYMGDRGLSFDASGRPWVVYRDNTNGTLRVATTHLSPTPLSDASQVPYIINSSAISGDARYRLNAGESPRNGSCNGVTDKMGYCGVKSDDSNYDSITTLGGERPIYTFAEKVSSNSNQPSAIWKGRTNIAPSTSGLTLEVYRFGTTNAWESLDTDTASSDCDTQDCTLSGTTAGTASEYYESDGSSYWLYFRVAQETNASSITLKTNCFNGTSTVCSGRPSVSLDSPSDGGQTSDTTPRLSFTGTDPDADDVRYNVQVNKNSDFSTTVTRDNSTLGSGATSNNITFSHTVNSGNDKILVVGVSTRGGSIASVTYDGQNLTEEAQVLDQTDSDTALSVSLWYLVNPPTGTADVVVNRTFNSNTQGVVAGATSYFNVDQTSPIYNSKAEDKGITGSPSTSISSLEDSVVLDVIGFPDDGSGVTPSAGSGQTELWVSSVVQSTRGAGSEKAGATSVTMSWDIRSEKVLHGLITFNPSSDGEIDVVSGTDSGFENLDSGADTDPFNSGDTIGYTVQSGDELNTGTTYYWRARGIDPNGSNAYGSWSSIRSFTVTSGPSNSQLMRHGRWFSSGAIQPFTF